MARTRDIVVGSLIGAGVVIGLISIGLMILGALNRNGIVNIAWLGGNVTVCPESPSDGS
jgi:hypothetical protein